MQHFRQLLFSKNRANRDMSLVDIKKTKSRRKKLVAAIFALLVIISSVIITPLQPVLAAPVPINPTKTQTLDPVSQAKSFAYYKALRTCLSKDDLTNMGGGRRQNTFSQADSTTFNWFRGYLLTLFGAGTVNVGVINETRNVGGVDTNNGTLQCGGDEGKVWIESALKLWGYSSATVPDFLCNQLAFTRASGGSATCTDMTANAVNNFIPPTNPEDKLDTFWKTKLGNASVNPSSIRPLGGEYALNLNSFLSQCRPSKGGGSVYVTLEFADGDATVKPIITTYGAPDTSRTPGGFRPTIYDGTQKSCQELADAIKDQAYMSAVAQDPDGKRGQPLVTNEIVKGYMAFLRLNGGSAAIETGGCTSGSTDPACKITSSCSIENGLGWIICPIMDTLSNVSNALYTWIESILILNPLTQDIKDAAGNSTPSPQYANWSIVRNIANVLLVIAFLFVIFSQITSFGISNYGVKKMLPRVIMIAIAINLSWLIMSLAVDVVNVAGIGINGLLDAAAINATTDTVTQANLWGTFVSGTTADALQAINNGTLGLGAGVVVGGASLIAGPVLGLSLGTLALMALPFLLGAFLALLAAVVTLFLRNAIVIILVIIAPVAFVAYLLPNTEEWFKKWRKMFITMLLLFPMAALLFFGAKFAAYILLTSEQPFNVITALFVMAAPLGALPWLARSSGGIMAAVGGKLQNIAKSGQTSLQKGLQPRINAQKAEYRSGQRNFIGFKRRASKQYNPINGSGKMTGAQKWGNIGLNLKAREDNAGKIQQATWKEQGLRAPNGKGSEGQQRQARIVAEIIDTGKREDLRGEAADAQYKGRLETAKLVPGQTRDIYDRLKDAQTTTSTLEHEQTLRQTDRIINNAPNTARAGINLTSLKDVSTNDGKNMTAEQAVRLRTLSQESMDPSGGGGLQILHENQEAAEFANKNLEDKMQSDFEKSKLTDGANAGEFAKSILGKTDSEKTAAEQKRIETEARLGKNQLNKDGVGTLFSQEFQKDAEGNILLDKDKNPMLALGSNNNALGAIRDLDQDTQASTAAAAWAAGGKDIAYAKEIQDGTDRGKELAVAASGADVRDVSGKQEIDPETGENKISILTQAKAAKAVLEDELSDETTIVSLAKSTSLENADALAKLGVDYYGKPLGGGDLIPLLSEKPTEERGYIRYAAGRQDRGTTMALLSYLGTRGKLANEAAGRIKDKTGTQADVELVEHVRKAQAAFQESVGSSLPPWIGGSDQQKIAEGRFEFSNEESAIAAVASGKMTADAFAAMDINNREAFVKALKQVPANKAEHKNNFAIDSTAKKFAREKYDLEFGEGKFKDSDSANQLKLIEEQMPVIYQNIAQTIIPIDKAQFDGRLSRTLAARDREQYAEMRKQLRSLSEGYIAKEQTSKIDPKTKKPLEEDYGGYKQGR